MERPLSVLALILATVSLTIAATQNTCDCSPATAQGTPTETAEMTSPVATPVQPTPESTTSTTTTPLPVATANPAVIDRLVTGIDATAPVPDWQKPQLAVAGTDPAYGTPVTRLTSAEGTRFNRNTYSRRNPENASGELFFTYHGDATYNVYDTTSGSLILVTDIHPDGEPQWHPTNPNILRHLSGDDSYTGDLALYETDVTTGQTTIVADLTPEITAAFGDALYLSDRAEGTPSQDGNRYAWFVFDSNEDVVGVVTVDLSNEIADAPAPVIIGKLSLADLPAGRADFVSASPTGEHVVLGGEFGIYAYDFDLTNPTKIHDKAEHSDIAINANGQDVYVHVDFSAASETAGWVVSRNLVTGETTRFFDLYDDANTSIHFSGKAYDAPGWIVASTYNCKETAAWSCEKVFAFNVDTGAIVHLAHTYNCGDSYWTETQAAANRDLSRVYFNSDGGTCGIDAEVYRLDVPTLTEIPESQ